MKNKKELPYDTCCYFCEHGRINPEDDSVFCKKKKKEVSPDGTCHAFFYDLLRRTPALPKLPEVELPTLD